MAEATRPERTFGTIGLGAAAFAANLALWALTDAVLRCRVEHLQGLRVETLDALVDEAADRLALAEMVEASIDQSVEEVREDAHGAIDEHLNELSAALSAYSRGHQRHHAEVAPDLSAQLACIERDAGDVALGEHDQLDGVANDALARIGAREKEWTRD
jgi:hypothetical protein